MLGNSSSPSTFYVHVAPRIFSILCPSKSNVEGKLVQDYVHTSHLPKLIIIINDKLSETRSSVSKIVYVLTILVGFFQRIWISHQLSLYQVNIPLYIDKVLYFHILVLLEYSVSAESKRPFKPVLEGMRAAALSIQRHAETE